MLGSLITGAASLLGGVFNRNAQNKANAANAAAAENNIALQREFAQSGIQWKVADAKKAGIHPLYALGANTHSFAPVSVGQSASPSFGNALAASGQDIGRAIHATQTPSGRTDTISSVAQGLQLENMKLQNQLLSSKIAQLNATPNPAMPTDGTNYLVPGQAQSGAIKPKALEVAPGVGAGNQEGGAITDIGHAQTGTGLWPIPSKDVKERIEDVTPYEWEHYFRNRIMPTFGHRLQAPYPAPPGKEWWYNSVMGEYQLHSPGSRPTAGHRVPGRR